MDLYMITEEQLAWRNAVAAGLHSAGSSDAAVPPVLPAHLIDAAYLLYHEAPASHPVHAGTARAGSRSHRPATLPAAGSGRHPALLGQAVSCLTTLRAQRAGLRHVDIAGLRYIQGLEALNLSGNDLGLGVLTYRGEPVSVGLLGLGSEEELDAAAAAARSDSARGRGRQEGVGEADGAGIAGVPGSALLGLSALPQLRSLDVSDNGLTSLPGLVPGGLLPSRPLLFPRLTTLSLAYNPGLRREGLAAVATALPWLEQLDVSGTGLSSLPLEIGCLTHIRVLSLGDNRLGGAADVHYVRQEGDGAAGHVRAYGWPASLLMLSRLPTLRELTLAHNQYSSLPEGILAPIREYALLGAGGQGKGGHATGFPALQYLDLSHNPLPPQLDITPLLRLPCLCEVQVKGTPAADEASTVPGRVHTAAPERILQFPGQQLVEGLQRRADASFLHTLQSTASMLQLELPTLPARGTTGVEGTLAGSTGAAEEQKKEEAEEGGRMSATLALLQSMAMERSTPTPTPHGVNGGKGWPDWLAIAQGAGAGAGAGAGRRVKVVLRGEYANDRLDSRARQRSSASAEGDDARQQQQAGQQQAGGQGRSEASPPTKRVAGTLSRTGSNRGSQYILSAPSFAASSLAGQGMASSATIVPGGAHSLAGAGQAKLPSATKAPQRLSTAAELAAGRVRLSAMPVRIRQASTTLLSSIPRAAVSSSSGSAGATSGKAGQPAPAPLVAATAAVLPSYAAPLLEVDPALNRLAASALLVREREDERKEQEGQGGEGGRSLSPARRANPRAQRVLHLHEAYGTALFNPAQGEATGKYVFDGHAYVPQMGWGDGQQSALLRELDYLLAPGTGIGLGDAAGGILASQRAAYRAMLELGSEPSLGPDGLPLPWVEPEWGKGEAGEGSAFARAKSRGRARSRSQGKTRWLEELAQAEGGEGAADGSARASERARERVRSRTRSPCKTSAGPRTAQELLGFDADVERERSQHSLAALQQLLSTVAGGPTPAPTPAPTTATASAGREDANGKGAAALLAAMLQS